MQTHEEIMSKSKAALKNPKKGGYTEDLRFL